MIFIPSVSIELAEIINSFKRADTTRDSYLWRKTFQAAMFCAVESGRGDVDWHSLLLENRRFPFEYGSDDDRTIVHGNKNRLDELPNVDMKRRYYYAEHDLKCWVDSIIKANLLPAQLH